MTSIQNGGYSVWVKTNYRVYLRCIEFLSGFNYPSFFLGLKRFRGVHYTRRNRLFDVANQMATLKEALSVGDLRCLGVSRNFSCLGMIYRFF